MIEKTDPKKQETTKANNMDTSHTLTNNSNRYTTNRLLHHVLHLFDLSERIWLVSIVMTLVVSYLFGCVFSTIRDFPLTCLFVCIICLCGTWCAFIFKKLHRLHIVSSQCIIVLAWQFPPPWLSFFYSAVKSYLGFCAKWWIRYVTKWTAGAQRDCWCR